MANALQPTPVTRPPSLNVLDPDFYTDPREAIEWLQRESPIHRCDLRPAYSRPFWILSKWADCRTVFGDTDLFVTRNGIHLAESLLTSEREEPQLAPPDPRFAVALKPVNYYDPPEHARIRMLMRDNFRPSEITKLEARVREIVIERLDRAGSGTVNFMHEVADWIPLESVCEMLGVGRERGGDFRRWAAAVFSSFEPGGEGNTAAVSEMFDFLEAQVNARREQPRDDVITRLLFAEHDGAGLSPDEILMWCWMVLVGGQETTANLLGGGLLALLRHPQQLELLRRDPSLIPAAVNEMLRWTTPDRYMCRTVDRATTLGGVDFAAGDFLYLWYTAANRDPDVFADPFRFDVTRTENASHLAFGFGPHFCIGAPLARLEARIMFEELLQRFPDVALAGEATYRPTTRVSMLAELPIRLA